MTASWNKTLLKVLCILMFSCEYHNFNPAKHYRKENTVYALNFAKISLLIFSIFLQEFLQLYTEPQATSVRGGIPPLTPKAALNLQLLLMWMWVDSRVCEALERSGESRKEDNK